MNLSHFFPSLRYLPPILSPPFGRGISRQRTRVNFHTKYPLPYLPFGFLILFQSRFLLKIFPPLLRLAARDRLLDRRDTHPPPTRLRIVEGCYKAPTLVPFHHRVFVPFPPLPSPQGADDSFFKITIKPYSDALELTYD